MSIEERRRAHPAPGLEVGGMRDLTADERRMLKAGWRISRTKMSWGIDTQYIPPPAVKEPTDLDLRFEHMALERRIARLRYELRGITHATTNEI
jgi:hypothetical protein